MVRSAVRPELTHLGASRTEPIGPFARTGPRPPLPGRWPEVTAFAAFLGLAVILTWPLVAHPATQLPIHLPDTLHQSFLLSWDAHALATRPWDLLDAPYFFPFPRALVSSEPFVGAAILGLPVWLASHNPVLVYNAVLLLSFPIAGFGAYLLARDATGSRLAGLVAGIVFAFSAYRMSRLMHLHVLLAGLTPYVLLLAIRFVRTRSWTHALGGAAASVALFGCSAQGAIALVTVLPPVVAILLLRDRGAIRDRRLWGRALVAAGLASVVVAPFVVSHVVATRDEPTFRRSATEVAFYSGGVEALVTAPENNRMYAGTFDAARHASAPWERWMFPGFTLLLTAAAGTVATVRGSVGDRVRTLGLVSLALALFAGTLSLGMTADGGGAYGLLHGIVPGLDSVRVPGRFYALASLGLASLAAIAVAAFRGTTAGRVRWRGIAFGLALSVLLLAEALPHQADLAPIPEGSPAYAWLAGRPRPSPVLELPADQPATSADGLGDARYLVHVPKHWQPIANGHSSNFPSVYEHIVETARALPSASKVAELRSLGLRYLVVHRELVEGTDWDLLERSVARTHPDAIVFEASDAVVIDLTLLG